MTEQLVCDNASVGIIARDDQGRILMIKRKREPFGIAPPSGHLDGLTYPVACFVEFEQETGLRVVGAPRPLIPKSSRKNIPCRRGGQYHIWQIFEVDWEGELCPNEDETLGARWYTVEEIRELAMMAEEYIHLLRAAQATKGGVVLSRVVSFIEERWKANPGLEPVWYEFFRELNII